mgnify:CR=1 FL=1
MKAYQSLPLGQRKIYSELCERIDRLETEIAFENQTFADVSAAFQAVYEDRPDFFWLNGSCKATTKTLGSRSTVYFRPQLTEPLTAASISLQRRRLSQAAETLVRQAVRSNGNLYEQIVYLHDYMVQHTEYRESVHCHDAYGCLVEGRAVCAGYAAAFQLLMQKLAVECGRVHGGSATKKHADSSHEWNYIRLSDGYYFVDVTWDDPVVNGSSAGDRLSHAFFCIDLQELRLTHRLAADQRLPQVWGRQFQYYRYRGRYLDTYSFAAAQRVIQPQLRTGHGFSVKFGSAAQTQAAVRDLIDGQKVYTIPGMSDRISYNVSDSGLILEVTLR